MPNRSRNTQLDTPSAFVRAAQDIDVDPLHALRCRYRYLKAEYRRMEREHALTDITIPDECSPYFWWMQSVKEEMDKVTAYAKRMKTKPVAGTIDDRMVETAKAFPLNQLIAFEHGRTLAFCHEDHTPSAYYAPRVNKLACPVCNKYFDPIDVLCIRDGLSFPAAVRALQ